jgi:hypothetical protein
MTFRAGLLAWTTLPGPTGPLSSAGAAGLNTVPHRRKH